jgi:hypothetical protein
LNNGTFTCSGCDKHNVEQDYNQYSATYTQTRLGSIVESNSTYCYIPGTNCCGQSTTQVWENTGNFMCVDFNKYNQERQTNPCASGYLDLRLGSFIESNSEYCGYVAPTPTPVPTSTPTPTPAPTTYTIDYDFSQNAESGDFSITVNGSVPVSVTSTSSGQITVPIGAAIGVSVGAGANSPLVAQAGVVIYDAGTKIYDNVQEGTPFAGLMHNYTATGNGTISATASFY